MSQPWLAAAVTHTQVVVVDPESPAPATAAITLDWRIHVNPKWAARTDIPDIATRFGHLIEHVCLSHGERAKAANADPSKWTAACHHPSPKFEEHLWSEMDADMQQCGSGCDGTETPWEDIGSQPHSTPVLQSVCRNVSAQASDPASGAPDNFAKSLAALLTPTAHWEDELFDAVQRAEEIRQGATDYTFTRPSRRASPNVILPRLVARDPKVAVITDTSGSMRDFLGQADAELKAIIERLSLRDVTYYAVSDTVEKIATISHADDHQSMVGGATDMRPGIHRAVDDSPTLIVVLTDGETPWPEQPTDMPLVVGLLGESRHAEPVPDWANTVRIRPSSQQRKDR